MPIRQCRIDNKPGYKWGQKGTCYDYNPQDEQSKYQAKRSAINQGIAIGDFEAIAIQVALFKGTYTLSEIEDYDLAESYDDYPEAAKNNAKRALEYKDKNGSTCGTLVGWARANQLSKGEKISEDTINRMASFKRHQQYKDVPYDEGCGGIMWDAWGGDAGIEWAIKKADRLRTEQLAITSMGFDFDGVLSTLRGQSIARQSTAELYIITARSATNLGGYYGSAEVYKVADKLNIPRSNVFFEGSNQRKIAKVKELGLTVFYDNNQEVVRRLPFVGKLF